MTSSDDNDLVKRCLSGDQKAFESLLDRYQKPIFNVALRMVGDADDAADLTQTVFVRAYEKLGTYNDHYKFFSWLYKIAVNASINFLEQRKRYDVLTDREVSQEPLVEDQVDASDRVEKLETAILELSTEYRIVIVIRHFHDLSYDEMGRILDLPEKTVKSRLFTARQLLKEILLKAGLSD